ncbi:BTAD domain-containing putative transcriptional regulator [Streptomyces sp. NPDC052236]|uniref:BTAD domain-containing putative transcriptional regulator n=1 Tax=Streptomyces sp. NPDC052236 TaxID=3365686 RepID=UPI0037D2D50D
MRFGVLGPLALWTADGDPIPVPVPGAKVRSLLAQLLVHPGRPVSVERLVDDLWGSALPDHPGNTLQGKVSQLRRVLERVEPGGRELVVSGPAGYLLRIDAAAVDAGRFSALLDRTRATAEPRAKAALVSEALGLWRGEAYADFADEPFARAEIIRLQEERLAALEEQAEVRMELGEHGPLVGELGSLVARYPLRERLRSLQLRALYRAGRQTEALDSYEDLRRRLSDDLGLEPGGELVALRQAILRQDSVLGSSLPGSSLPGSSLPATRTNLPVPIAEIIGRDQALPGVRHLLTASRSRLVTLTGPGGVGKTRLAVEIARQSADSFPDGVWFVELAPLDAPHAVGALAETVMKALDIRQTGEAGEQVSSSVGRLAGALRGRQLLIVLDNCEHLIHPAAELVETLLRNTPGLTILATSQEPLGIGGEHVWPVPPLELPSAVDLFLARAATAPGFTLDVAGAEAVAVLCTRLDGIPLALELAASRVRTIGVHGLVARLGDDRFGLLTGGTRNAPARQRTLRAVIDWSWQLLTAAERIVLRRLAVHAEGCTLEAAEAVCAGDGLESAAVLDLLARLVDRSLVVLDDRPDGPRYRLLESVKEYCLEQLRAADEFDAVRERHSHHYVELALRAGPLLRKAEQRHWLERLDQEGANLRRAIDFAVQRGAADRELRTVNALAWYWVLRGRFSEARRSLETVLAAAPAHLTPPRALAMAWQAGTALLEGTATDGATRIRAALSAYEAVDDPSGRATALWFLGATQMGSGAVAAGETLVNQALEGFRALGDTWGTAAVLSVRARHAMARGDLDAVRLDGERSASLFHELGDPWGRLQTVFPLAALSEITGDYARAVQLQREGLNIAEQIGLWAEAAKRLSGLGRLALLMDDCSQARTYHQRALKLSREQNFRSGEVDAEIGLGLGARREGDYDLAETHMRALLSWFREVGYGPGTTLALAELGFVAELRGDATTAHALHLEGFDAARELGDPRAVALSLEGLAGAQAVGGHHRRSALLLGAAAAARESVGAPLPPAERRDVDRIAAGIRDTLGREAFTAEFDRGTLLGFDQARALSTA